MASVGVRRRVVAAAVAADCSSIGFANALSMGSTSRLANAAVVAVVVATFWSHTRLAIVVMIACCPSGALNAVTEESEIMSSSDAAATTARIIIIFAEYLHLR